MIREKKDAVTFDQLQVNVLFKKRNGKVIRVISFDDKEAKVELEGLKGQVFTLSKESVNRGKYSFL
jgi:hypothetical protein